MVGYGPVFLLLSMQGEFNLRFYYHVASLLSGEKNGTATVYRVA